MKHLELSQRGIEDVSVWEQKGYRLPQYDRVKMIAETKAAPEWVHFGAGNLFKAFHCRTLQELLDAGYLTKGVVAVERAQPGADMHDGLTVAVTLKSDGTIEKTVIGSVAETSYLFGEECRLAEIFQAPTLKMVSFTITEKGYRLTNTDGKIHTDVQADMLSGPNTCISYMGKITALLYQRFLADRLPLAMVSMDNCSHNGDVLRAAVLAFADAWAQNGKVSSSFADYLRDESCVSFPWTMIDKITPSPDPAVGTILEQDGLVGLTPVRNEHGTVSAPYVNAEETEYLIMEDSFPNGRLPLDRAGVRYTDRETVDRVERMKVTTCLNPLHTCLAIFGCLLGYDRIWKEMRDNDLVRLIRHIGYEEGLPVVTDPGIIDPKEFIDTVVNVRLVNPFIPDMPRRIATDTSQKLPVRYGETVKAYLAAGKADELRYIPLVFAGWLRYLMAVDDDGNAFTPSPDPLLSYAQAFVKDFTLVQDITVESVLEKVSPLLSNAAIFGTDLVKAGMADLVCRYFISLTANVGAVRRTLHSV